MHFVINGYVCLLIGLVFGLFNQVMTASGWAPNVTNAGASCGFAIAGGLCFIAAALQDKIASRHAPLQGAIERTATSNE